ncbi:uncharacterized protein PV07_00956 [Cladophialophora immunda]|uniref:Uncharacterized protein n=1 Tax=Cladophialophora immunda TaxID=569365 RepID=A0A0D2CWB5_9EURO|nr:uncharacterized protein PV07_00956 [Cladophialophora immunda]KIW34160.1 hypothetical protein PV07_00956 [Cladophialophora immunda]
MHVAAPRDRLDTKSLSSPFVGLCYKVDCRTGLKGDGCHLHSSGRQHNIDTSHICLCHVSFWTRSFVSQSRSQKEVFHGHTLPYEVLGHPTKDIWEGHPVVCPPVRVDFSLSASQAQQGQVGWRGLTRLGRAYSQSDWI